MDCLGQIPVIDTTLYKGNHYLNFFELLSKLLQNQQFFEETKGLYFSDFSQVKAAYDRGFLALHTPVWVKWSGCVQNFFTEHQARTKDSVIETRLDLTGRGENLFLES